MKDEKKNYSLGISIMLVGIKLIHCLAIQLKECVLHRYFPPPPPLPHLKSDKERSFMFKQNLFATVCLIREEK